jgi:hypothetical protein
LLYLPLVMEVITIGGVKYIKASQIAKQFKYTADYVGQLCRGKKVDSKLVGRTWYVNPLSLEDHKANRYSTKPSNTETTSPEVHEVAISRQSVEAVVRKSTFKSLSREHENKTQARFLKRVDWQPIKFESDETELMPNISKAELSKRINVDPAGAEQLEIKSENKPFIIERDELPTVSLGGDIKIHSIEDDFVDNNEEIIAIPEDTQKKSIQTKGFGKISSHKMRLKKVDGPSLRPKNVNSGHTVNIQDVTKLNFTPRRINNHQKARITDVPALEEENVSSHYLRNTILLLFVAGLFALTVGLESVVLADGQNSQQSFRLSL